MHLRSPEQQWMWSFLIVDAVVFLFFTTIFILSPTERAGIAGFAPAVYYAPVYPLIIGVFPEFDPSFTSMHPVVSTILNLAIIVGIGSGAHALIGYGIGYLSGQRQLSWWVTIPLSAVFIFALIWGGSWLMFTLGYFI